MNERSNETNALGPLPSVAAGDRWRWGYRQARDGRRDRITATITKGDVTMLLRQSFETTVLDADSNLAFKYIALPLRRLRPEAQHWLSVPDRTAWNGNLPPFAAHLPSARGFVFSDNEISQYMWLLPDLFVATLFPDEQQAEKRGQVLQ